MYKPYNIEAFGFNHKNHQRNRLCVKDPNFLDEIDQILESGVTAEEERYVHSHLYTNKSWVPKWLLIDLLDNTTPPVPPTPTYYTFRYKTTDNNIIDTFTSNQIPPVEQVDLGGGWYEVRFENPITSMEKTSHQTTLEEIILPDTITEFPSELSQFVGCTNLKHVVMPKYALNTSYGMFYNCRSLTEIELPDTIHTIRVNTFFGTNISYIKVPSNVIQIGSRAFMIQGSGMMANSNDMDNMDDMDVMSDMDGTNEITRASRITIDFLPTIPPQVQNDAYIMPQYTTIRVPEESINLYKAKRSYNNDGTNTIIPLP